jgi:hypothetical protein
MSLASCIIAPVFLTAATLTFAYNTVIFGFGATLLLAGDGAIDAAVCACLRPWLFFVIAGAIFTIGSSGLGLAQAAHRFSVANANISSRRSNSAGSSRSITIDSGTYNTSQSTMMVAVAQHAVIGIGNSGAAAAANIIDDRPKSVSNSIDIQRPIVSAPATIVQPPRPAIERNPPSRTTSNYSAVGPDFNDFLFNELFMRISLRRKLTMAAAFMWSAAEFVWIMALIYSPDLALTSASGPNGRFTIAFIIFVGIQSLVKVVILGIIFTGTICYCSVYNRITSLC